MDLNHEVYVFHISVLRVGHHEVVVLFLKYFTFTDRFTELQEASSCKRSFSKQIKSNINIWNHMKVVYFSLPFDLNLEVFVFHISGVRVGQHEVVIFFTM